MNIYISRTEVLACHTHQFGGNDPPVKIFGDMKRSVLRYSKDPAYFAAALLRVDQVADCDDVKAALKHPVEPRKAGIQCPMLFFALSRDCLLYFPTLPCSSL